MLDEIRFDESQRALTKSDDRCSAPNRPGSRNTNRGYFQTGFVASSWFLDFRTATEPGGLMGPSSVRPVARFPSILGRSQVQNLINIPLLIDGHHLT
jgi:hypothetical protein